MTAALSKNDDISSLIPRLSFKTAEINAAAAETVTAAANAAQDTSAIDKAEGSAKAAFFIDCIACTEFAGRRTFIVAAAAKPPA